MRAEVDSLYHLTYNDEECDNIGVRWIVRDMKVAFVYGAYPPIRDGGAGFLKNLAYHLVNLGVEVSVITTSKIAANYSVESQDKIQVLPVIEDWSLSLANFNQLRKALDCAKPDVAHTIFPSSTWGGSYHLPMLIKFARSAPLVTTLYGFAFRRGSMGNRLAIMTLLHVSDRLSSDNDFVIGIIKRYLPYLKGRLRYLPSGSNIPNEAMNRYTGLELRHRYNLDKDSFYVCHFGYLDRTRGIEVLFNAVKLLRDKGRDVRVIMIGGSPYHGNKEYFAKLSKLITQLNLDPYVVWTGFCSEEQVAHYFLCSNACVLPFRKNTTGRSSLPAALSFGLPVVTTSKEKSIFSLRDHENVLLVPPGDVNRLENAIDELIDDSELRKRLGRAAYELWETEFSWDSIARRALKVYLEVAR